MRQLAILALLMSGCGDNTYVRVSFDSMGVVEAIQRIDMNLELDTRTASAKLSGNGKPISLPATAVLAVKSGQGTMTVTANAINLAGEIASQAIGMVDVKRGSTVELALSFAGTDAGDGSQPTDGGRDLTADPCNKCSPLATCSVSGGAATCTCPTGYSGDGTRCTDIDECAATPGPCDVNAKCSNSAGSFTCMCNQGYRGDGINCRAEWVLLTEVPNLDLANTGDAVGINDRLYFGNENSTQHFSSIDVTNPGVLQVEPLMPPTPPGQNDWCWCGGASMAGRFVVVGTNAFFMAGSFEFFNGQFVPGSWTSLAAPYMTAVTPPRTDAGYAAVGGKIYAIGGYDAAFNPTNTVLVANVTTPASPTFSYVSNYPIAVTTPVATAAGGKIYVFGGTTLLGTTTVQTRSMYVFDPTANGGMGSWTQLANIPFDTHYGVAYSVVYNNKIWVFDSSFPSKLQSFDPSAGTWDPNPVDPPPGGKDTNRGWVLATAGMAAPSLYALNYEQDLSAMTVKIVIYKYVP